MSDAPFHTTRCGRQFFEVTMPELVRQLTRLNDMLALAVELTEKNANTASGEIRNGAARKPTR